MFDNTKSPKEWALHVRKIVYSLNERKNIF